MLSFILTFFTNLFSANFYLFFAGFLQEIYNFLQKTRINIYIFYVKTRQELNEWVVRHALSPRAEPLPEYGREGMVAIREFYRKLADDEGTVQFYANHPSKYHSFSKKIAPCLILESIFKHGSIFKNINLSVRIFGSGF